VRTGIFGGTFDPPHIGHLIAAQDAQEALQLDCVLFVPAGQPPHKSQRPISDGTIRRKLLEAALQDDPRFEVCLIELERTGKSYTVDTVRQLLRERPGDSFFLLVGADQVREFHTWHEPDEIVRLVTVVPLARAGVDNFPALESRLHAPVSVTRIDVSATDIRRRVFAGKSIRYLVVPAVEQLIREHGLYKNAEAPGQVAATNE
jgi:nicotinate-nucleotide adenylyltransferase